MLSELTHIDICAARYEASRSLRGRLPVGCSESTTAPAANAAPAQGGVGPVGGAGGAKAN